METDKYLDEIARLWPHAGETPTKELVDLCLGAVADHPGSSILWYYLGIVMELCTEEYGYTARDYVRCYENSLRCDPANPEAYQELGYVLDVYFSEYDKAEEALRKAIELGAGYESYSARARVLAEMGRAEDALDSVSENNCPFAEHPAIQKIRTEILEGNWGPR